MRHAVCLALALFGTGCVGRVAPSGDMYRAPAEGLALENRPGEPSSPSDAPVDQTLDRSAGDACAPNDVVTTCDPLAASSCAGGGACYLIKGQYLDCVCPPGTIDEGSACNTAVECKPGLTCFSSTGTPPGACRRLCDLKSPSCSSGEACAEIPNFTTLGYCSPSP